MRRLGWLCIVFLVAGCQQRGQVVKSTFPHGSVGAILGIDEHATPGNNSAEGYFSTQPDTFTTFNSIWNAVAPGDCVQPLAAATPVTDAALTTISQPPALASGAQSATMVLEPSPSAPYYHLPSPFPGALYDTDWQVSLPGSNWTG